MRPAPEHVRDLRLKSWRIIHEISGYVVSERLRQLNAMLAKYSPTQPRVPAGNPDGGQWTSGGGGGTDFPNEPPAKPGTGTVYAPPRGTPGTVFVPQQPNGSGRRIEQFPKPNPGNGPVLDAPIRAQGVGNKPDIGAALAGLIGQGIGTITNALGDVFSSFKAMVQDAFSGFDTPFEVPSIEGPNGEKIVPEQVNIFIGGAGDKNGYGPVLNSDALKSGVYGYNIYATHDKGAELSAAIQKLPANVEINVIGHSLGGNVAAQLAADNPGRINKLITIDPVGDTRANFASIRSSVSGWVNVNAAGKPNRSFWDRFSPDNLAAGAGGAWNSGPKGYADIYIDSPYSHGDFSVMIGYPGYNGWSAQQILNKKR